MKQRMLGMPGTTFPMQKKVSISTRLAGDFNTRVSSFDRTTFCRFEANTVVEEAETPARSRALVDPRTGAGIDGQGPLTPPLKTSESKFPPAIRAGPRKPASAAASGVGSGREIRFLPRAGARFPPNFTPSTQLSRSCPAAGRALPLPALPSEMHGHSRQQNRKARPLAEKGREARPARQRRVTNDRR